MRGCGDTRGVLELPVQYMIAVIVAGIAISLISFASYHVWRDHQLKRALHEVDKIVEEAERMCTMADENTIRHVQLHFPASMEKAVFGSADAPNHYYVLMSWGENRSFFSEHASFSGEDTPQAVLHSGIREVILELQYEGGERHVTISASS